MRNEKETTRTRYEVCGGRLYVNGERQAVVPTTVETALNLYEDETGIRFGRGGDGRTCITKDLGCSILRMESRLAVIRMNVALAAA